MSTQNETFNKGIKVPFRSGELELVESFLESTGRKLGPYTRVLLVNAARSFEATGKPKNNQLDGAS